MSIDQVQNAVGFLVNSVLLRIEAESNRLSALKDDLETVIKELKVFRMVLKRMTSNNELVKNWFKDIKEAVLEADCLLDEFSYDDLKNGPVVEKSGTWNDIKGKAKVTVTAVYNVGKDIGSLGTYVRKDKPAQVKKLLTKIQAIMNDSSKYKINIVKLVGGEDYDKDSEKMKEQEREDLKDLRGYDRVDIRMLLGRHEDEEKLRTAIHHCNSSLPRRVAVVGITGFPGVGKTALSKHIAKVMEDELMIGNDSSEDKTAECSSPKKAFDHVFKVFVSQRYRLTDILKQMADDLSIESMAEEGKLKTELNKKLKGKRFLLLLDDVWDTLKWVTLESALYQDIDASKVVILMTSRLPATEVFQNMKTLKDKKWVDAIYYVHKLEELKEDDRQSLFMARLGDELKAGSEMKEMAKDMLKRCGGVPLAITALALLLQGKTLEEYKKIKNSEIWDNKDHGIFPSLRLSYTYLPTEPLKKCFSFCSIFKEGEVINKDKLIYMWTAQGLLWKVVDNRGVDDKGESYDDMELNGEDFVKRLLNRSLFHEPKYDKFGNIISFKMHDLVCALARDVSKEQCWDIRMSNIGENWSSDPKEKQLENFKRIRYLELRVNRLNPTHTVLPGHFTELYHLQTLWINSSFNLETKKRPSVRFLNKVDKLVKLRHIRNDSSSIGIPKGLRYLTALYTLPTVNLAFDWGGSPEEIGSLENLRGKLEFRKLTCLKNKDEASSLNLKEKSKLDSLVLHWTELGYGVENPKADEILEALRPNEELKKLEIRQYDGTKFPSWFTGEIAVLPNLVSLEIQFGKAEGKVELRSFNFLRFLTLNHCPGLTITFPNNGIGCCKVLEEVMIEYCKKVITSESNSNMSMSPFIQLRSLHIWDNVAKNEVVLTGLSSLPRLSNLCIDDELVNLADLNETSPVCTSLKTLKLKNSVSTATPPNQLEHLVALRSINLVGFESPDLPNWLRRLTSLRLLELESWPELKQLPLTDVMQSLSNLHTLNIEDCRSLSEEHIKWWLENVARRRITLDDIPVYL